ncbi:glutamine-hydrolyzing carbamoyl-phosphate synthase small subunit [uncultured Enorma sp.]|uniref:glutamine-hydrolyzing carbamoyl-phosphate synthase small subunit n=1 Tax=uncultured Enorma sp. TaxID=1714346 RepID=UPI002591DA18|nr:glutamine-hydrolyzing carbamoyl-phosphate synthase small subunit [uncultured Enorma sp.]
MAHTDAAVAACDPGCAAHTAPRAQLSELAQHMLSQTSKHEGAPAVLMLADGTAFFGRACGARGTATGEVCFNTSVEGYFEVLTDPSYAGQIVTMTYPQIGNYGVDLADTQVASGAPGELAGNVRPPLRALVVRDLCRTPSNWRSTMSLPEYLDERGIVGIEGVDTRALVRHLRETGAQKGIVSTEVLDLAELRVQLDAAPELVGQNLVETVSCREAHAYDPGRVPQGHAFAEAPAAPARHRVVVYDCGVKRGILEGLRRAGCELTVVPWDTPAADVLARRPDGVFLSNGPGDPEAATKTYEQVRSLLGEMPVFGICLGHQMMSLAAGARMEKLKYGHRGGNHPVMNLITHRVEITAQNHGFNLVFPSLGELVPELSGGVSEHPVSADGTVATADLRFWAERGIAPVVANERFGRIRLTHVNLNDGTAEGIQFLDIPAFSVQYHPEASPGPTDAHYLFTAFTRLMDGDPDYLDINIARDRLAGWEFAAA